MKRLIITADIHGRLSAWRKLMTLLQPTDILAIAGDLFDTRYGHRDDPDFQPEKIRTEFQDLQNTKYYVYGNCDIPDFFPGQKYQEDFEFSGKQIHLTHGHLPTTSTSHVIITGHSHVAEIHEHNGTLYLNPGSLAKPRDGQAGVIIWVEREKPLHARL